MSNQYGVSLQDFPIDLSLDMASKRSLTLDLNNPQQQLQSKRTRFAAPQQHPAAGAAHPPPVLTTPDVQMLKLSSPEMAKFLTGNKTPAAPAVLFPKTVTEEQELYAKGFEEALKNMHDEGHKSKETAINTIEKATAALNANGGKKAQRRRKSSGSSSNNESKYTLPEAVRVKEEEPSDADDDDDEDGLQHQPHEPINMEAQEQIKLERKRQRNRVAASKCRKRKLERISQLDGRVQQLKGENGELAALVKKLKESVCNLKKEVMDHVSHGCQIGLSDIQQQP